ncbi:conserved hypothetical protein [Flavobacterium sp. 9AF]|uniref:DUF4270 family protein n=1 Tax=Flavobacterium sp. 9AF TaxID=2653142 RepID=UPI0012EF2A4F|nr:DUF4270 family protein [Flavobacterium sp. 9AF]VXB14644.1 conserved hypothetical protein [Flavobacterium sp. 9AF]
MKNIFYLFIVSFFLISCSDEEIDYFTPSNALIDSKVDFTVIDSISFTMSTLKIDSLATDLYSKILVGQYQDPYFGKTTASGYAYFVPSSYYIDNTYVFDSIVLNLKYSGYYYNDTLLQKKIQVYDISKRIKYRNGQTNYYNAQEIPTINLLGERTFYPRIAKDSVKITLDAAFGALIFNKIKTGAISNQDELNEVFKGLKITPSSDENASMISFDISNSYLRFYHSDPSDPGNALSYDFEYSDFSTYRNHFSNIQSDRTGTNLPVDFLNQENEIDEASLNHLTYIQAGVGITTKVTFPSFKESMNNLGGNIYKADLKIPLDKNLYNKNLYVGDSLRVFVVDINNEVVSSLIDSNGAQVNAYIKNENPEFNEAYLTVAIAPFLQNILSNNYYRNYGLIFMPFNHGITTNRLLLNSNHHSRNKAQVKLTLLYYDNE